MEIMVLLFQLSGAFTVFSYGLRASRTDLLYVLNHPRLLAVSLLAMFVVTPVAALAVSQVFDLNHIGTVALVALALAPLSPTLPKKEREGGGHAPYAVSLAVTVVALSIVVTPLMVAFLGNIMGRPFGVSSWDVFRAVGLIVFLPLILGIAAKLALRSVPHRLTQILARLSDVFVLVALVLLLIITGPTIVDYIDLGTVAAMVVFALASLGIGWVMGGPEPDHSFVLAFSCLSRHPAIALTIATTNYPGENFAAAVLLAVFIQGIVAGPFVNWYKGVLSIVRSPLGINPQS